MYSFPLINFSFFLPALLLLCGPEETQEELVWPRWLLPADTAKANEQSALTLLEVCATAVGG